MEWKVRAIRGATTVPVNSKGAIREAVDELLTALESLNELNPTNIVSATFSVTRDLDAIFPAAIARQRPGWNEVPLLDVQQMHVEGSLERCVRFLILVNTPNPDVHHPYLRHAKALRPDWSSSQAETPCVTLGSAIPMLPCRSLKETLLFYQQLGFTTTFQQSTPDPYAILCRDRLELHFFELATLVPDHSHAGCYLRVSDVDRFFQEVTRLQLPTDGIPRLGELQDKPWGMREFYIVDPSGNRLKIGAKL